MPAERARRGRRKARLSAAALAAVVLGLWAAAAQAQTDGVAAGVRLYLAGDMDAAQNQFGGALARDPSRAMAVAGLAAVHLARGDTTPALSSFRAAVALLPGEAWPLACLASAQVQAEDYAAAAATYRQALGLRPEWAEARARLAYALFCAGDAAGALDNARTAARQGETAVSSLVEAAALLALGDAAGALKALGPGGQPGEGLDGGFWSPALRMASLSARVSMAGAATAATAAQPATGGVQITWPRDGATLTGVVEVQASFDVPPAYAVLYVDDEFTSVTNATRMRARWDTTKWLDGAHRLRVDAHDVSGECRGRGEIQVIVANRERTGNAAQAAMDAALGEKLAAACQPSPPPWDGPLLRAEAARETGQDRMALDILEPAFSAWPWNPGLRDELHLACRGLGIANPQPAEILMLPTRRAVAVTFDDGPHPRITPWLLGVLAKRHIRATFFLVGQQCLEYPELAAAIRDAGHEVAIHSHTHRNLARMSPAEIERELVEARWALAKATGLRAGLFRPPGGHYSADVRAAAQALGFRTVFWNADNLRYAGRPLGGIVRGLMEDLQGGGILLAHNGDDETPLIIEDLLDRLARAGHRLGPVGELSGLGSAYLALGGGAGGQ